LADYWDLDFPGKKEADPGVVRDVGTALIRERPVAEQLRCALELVGAMWAGDRKAVTAGLGKWGTEAHIAVPPILNASYAELRKAGHYMGAMLRYADGWYWGIDRLPYLEAALAKDFGVELRHVVAPRADRAAKPISEKPGELRAEMWFSFRSPYSYLALEQIEAILAPYRIPLVLHAVPPMVDRGLQVPTIKRMYIVRDAKREAGRRGIAFGELCEPPPAGVERCLALARWANTRGAGLAFARSAMRGIWAEARDMAEYVDLRHVVERAELPWEAAKQA